MKGHSCLQSPEDMLRMGELYSPMVSENTLTLMPGDTIHRGPAANRSLLFWYFIPNDVVDPFKAAQLNGVELAYFIYGEDSPQFAMMRYIYDDYSFSVDGQLQVVELPAPSPTKPTKQIAHETLKKMAAVLK